VIWTGRGRLADREDLLQQKFDALQQPMNHSSRNALHPEISRRAYARCAIIRDAASLHVANAPSSQKERR
jgi:hypothetical protein